MFPKGSKGIVLLHVIDSIQRVDLSLYIDLQYRTHEYRRIEGVELHKI